MVILSGNRLSDDFVMYRSLCVITHHNLTIRNIILLQSEVAVQVGDYPVPQERRNGRSPRQGFCAAPSLDAL